MTWWFYFIVYRLFYSSFFASFMFLGSCEWDVAREQWIAYKIEMQLFFFPQIGIRTFVASHSLNAFYTEKNMFQRRFFVYEFHLYIDWIPMCTRVFFSSTWSSLWSLPFFSLKFFFFLNASIVHCEASSFSSNAKNVRTNFIWNLKYRIVEKHSNFRSIV